ncbi:uncharacterized protein LOC109419743 [Aedes albopictus]|uniref:Uncharacterized protein n=1 Tax=Aedes albopictus TaxID=7160 RepID=A0ABM1ZMM6_AEDAL
MECYYQKLNIIDENTLLMDKVNLYLESLEVPAREFYKAVFQTCDDQLMEVKEHKLVTICSTFAADMNQCVRKFVNQRCPEQYFRETELCNQVKAGRDLCMN